MEEFFCLEIPKCKVGDWRTLKDRLMGMAVSPLKVGRTATLENVL
jgi:hypothetical protein